jgi:hypothetical protein
LSEKAFPACKLCQTKYANCVRENVSGCKLCHVENERFGRNSLSKSKKVSNRTDLKTNLKNPSNSPAMSHPEKSLKLVKNQFLKTYQAARTCQAAKLSQTASTLNPKEFSKPENVSSGDKYWR